MTDKTGVVLRWRIFRVALRAVVHLHAIPGIDLISGDISSPDIDAIARHAIDLVRWEFLTFSMVSMAYLTFHIRIFDVGNVRKIDIAWLSVIRQPRDLLAFGHVIFEKEFFRLRIAHG